MKIKTLVVFALIVLLPSLYTITLMAREWWVGQRIDDRLHVDGEYSDLSLQWKGHDISLQDGVLPSDPSARIVQPWGFKERFGRVAIQIDGQDFTWPYDVGIRPESDRVLSRYHHWIFFGRLQDKEMAEEEFFIVQRFIKSGEDWYRLLRVPAQGKVREEIFPHSARTKPVERTFFVRLVYPNGIGFYSDVLQVWPSIIYPIAYPFGTGLLGVLLLFGAGLWKFSKFIAKPKK